MPSRRLSPEQLARLEALHIPVKAWSRKEMLAVLNGHRTLGELAGVSKERQLELQTMGLQLLNTGLKDKAREVFLGLEALDPYDAYVQVVLGTISLDDKEWKEADRRFTRAIELNPVSVPALYHRGTLRLQQGKARAGIDDLNRAVAREPNGPLAARAKAMLAAAATKKAPRPKA